jgi:hypothetical protein
VLPLAALLPVCAFAGLFPIGAPWYRQRAWRAAAALVLTASAGAVFVSGVSAVTDAGQALPVPVVGWAWLPVALFAILAAGAGRPQGPRRLGTLVLAVAAGVWLPVLVARHEAALATEAARLAREEAAYATGVAPESAWREVFLALRAGERATGRHCEARRLYALTRFDEPLALQSPTFTSEVYYAGRNVAAAERAGPLGVCDYIVSTDAALATDKGEALVRALAGEQVPSVIATVRDVRVLGLPR